MSSESAAKQRPARRADIPLLTLQWTAFALSLTGFILIVLSSVGVLPVLEGSGANLAAITAAGIAGFAAMTSVRTWTAQKHQSMDEMQRRQREAIYASLVDHYLQYFNGGSTSSETSTRAQVVTWGSASVLNAISHWRSTINSLPTDQQGRHISQPGEERRTVQEALSQLVLSIRNDLGLDTTDESPSVETVAMAMFDDASKKEVISPNPEAGAET